MADELAEVTDSATRTSTYPMAQQGIFLPHLRWALTQAGSAIRLRYWISLIVIVIVIVAVVIGAAVVP